VRYSTTDAALLRPAGTAGRSPTDTLAHRERTATLSKPKALKESPAVPK
jgi:hypothetical protein